MAQCCYRGKPASTVALTMLCFLQAIVHIVDTVLLPSKESLGGAAPAPAPMMMAGMMMAPMVAKPAAMAPMMMAMPMGP